ncbi:SIS domain-containing protein [Sulfolobus acidocaldarius]|uniref:Conserved protein n=4 Tax=Sulfolobus acidocaldarius TaxID=2285 RepID=Q4J9T2_SULAC|nr:SIS domain-containing protein [Sulfolobus acidocaldarius]AAY80448.1 conserved protein [Sulfolobus acidocaldarius DSM 639]AGE71033.1 hypothetical protein SacN8_05320 [Sulfolobus acidocaldarius N8]AGE73304.1 hypothetical protein SacRon12I_05310 [Sulfolobus acidocaldarius Ron12/I]ALU28675.1 sugar isomerase [Sulfolobus acidocaldarius]ALU31392.1 sugar isomerase [Sulfolobus acidocaldarius]
MYIESIERELSSEYLVYSDLKLDRAYVTGAGDSYAVALTVEGKTNGRFRAIDPYEALAYNRLEYPLVIVSVSGKPKSNIRLAEKFKGKTKIYVVTANEESILAKLGDYVITIPYRSKQVVPGTLSFLMSLSAVYSLAGEEVARNEINETVDLSDSPFFVGYRENYGIAYYGMLKFSEIFGYSANAERLEQFLHSPIFSTKGREIVLLSSGDSREDILVNLVNYTKIAKTPCSDAFCNAKVLLRSIVQKMKRENWDRVYFLETKNILDISSKMIY